MQVYIIKGKYKGNVMDVLSHSNEVFTVTGNRRFKASHLAFTREDAEKLAKQGGPLQTEYKIREDKYRPPYMYSFVQASTGNRGNRLSFLE